jgi:hypothetical protein
MIACLKCGIVFLDSDIVEPHDCIIESEPRKKKNALPERFGLILILYGILQMPVYYFIIRLSYNHEAWFQALIATDVTPGIVFYALGLWMISIVVLIGGVALILTRDTQSTISTIDDLADSSDYKPKK